MNTHGFWFVDDNHRVRWAVCVTGTTTEDQRIEPRIVFTSRDRQVQTSFALAKDQSQLSRYEILELLSQAKSEAVFQANHDHRAAA